MHAHAEAYLSNNKESSMKSILRRFTGAVAVTSEFMTRVTERAEDLYRDHPDDAIVMDLARSATIALACLLTATTGKSAVSIGLKDRSVKPWVRKMALALAAREVVSASISGMVLRRRYDNARTPLRMRQAHEDRASFYE